MFCFNEHLKLLRKNKGFTQKYMAEQIGIALRNYQKYESNEQLPAFEPLIKIADVLDISLDYLVGRSDDPQRH